MQLYIVSVDNVTTNFLSQEDEIHRNLSVSRVRFAPL